MRHVVVFLGLILYVLAAVLGSDAGWLAQVLGVVTGIGLGAPALYWMLARFRLTTVLLCGFVLVVVWNYVYLAFIGHTPPLNSGFLWRVTPPLVILGLAALAPSNNSPAS
ncbi:hypothetical protein HMPREF1219_01066 [Corynebacterium pyruviciproducens ATCC BAA-1742]|uniref:Uncharacterized protein n=1 Tax=Corynebacterium pyruviciproducens ATCC BAA-1742 TaxID=1125779 RepID=S3A062_9CORY|nr:hypothetical protein [Corynebacterium pyruviciproducens]EPD69734.1 hypothetical protein HMPREF1219_01066 [Corynebacterium pyruviciproducens ATCC BAA-1742]